MNKKQSFLITRNSDCLLLCENFNGAAIEEKWAIMKGEREREEREKEQQTENNSTQQFLIRAT